MTKHQKRKKFQWIFKTNYPKVSLLSRLLHFFEHLSRLYKLSKNNVKTNLKFVVTKYMHVFRIAKRLKRNMRKCIGITIGILQAMWKYSGITIGILQTHVEGVNRGH
jgi:hypothetical protein